MLTSQSVSLNEVKTSKDNLEVWSRDADLSSSEGCLWPEAAAVSLEMIHTFKGQPKCSMRPPLQTSLTSHPGSTYSVILPGPPRLCLDLFTFKMSRPR